jgi:hypothetical protein
MTIHIESFEVCFRAFFHEVMAHLIADCSWVSKNFPAIGFHFMAKLDLRRTVKRPNLQECRRKQRETTMYTSVSRV